MAEIKRRRTAHPDVHTYNLKDSTEQIGKNFPEYELLGQVQNNPIREPQNSQYRIGEKGLLGETLSIKKSNFAKNLNEWYGREPNEMEVYTAENAEPYMLHPNQGKYDNYLNYIDEIGHLSFPKRVINALSTWDESRTDVSSYIGIAKTGSTLYEILSTFVPQTDIKLAIEANKVGVLRHFSVHEALDGIITTNVNNFSHDDTELGKITNELYANTLKYASYFNTARNTHYITDYLKNYYGTNTYNLRNLTYRLNVDQERGRMGDIDYNEYLTELSIYNDGDYSSIDDYFKTIEGKTEYDTDYNRYQNFYQNWQDLPQSYLRQHTIYNPFLSYIDLQRGYSVDNIKDVEEAYTLYGINTQANDKIYLEYNEGDSTDRKGNIGYANIIDGNTFIAIEDTASVDPDKLLNKTAELFKNRKIGTLLGRFHTSLDTDATSTKETITQTAISKYGMSHGRNLLTKRGWSTPQGDDVNGYDNPYCRVWTYHHQYHRLKDAIRPFLSEENSPMGIAELQENWNIGLRTNKGGERLENFGTMNKNGLPNIAPTTGTSGINVKNCMFSIENLAWKDVNKTFAMNGSDNILSNEQIGPNGGRIMWFPPYNLTFNEQVSADWESTPFIGRGEPVVTYKNTTRKGTLDFTLLVDHPSIVDSWRKKFDVPSEDDEQELLRFFAGCGVLDPKETKKDLGVGDNEDETQSLEDVMTGYIKNLVPDDTLDSGYVGNKNLDNVIPGEDPILQEFVPKPDNTGKIIFYVFYPNNYSGKNDNTDDAYRYIINGANRTLDGVGGGYEMAEGTGITDPDYVLGTDNKTKWGYRVDLNYEHQILAKGNYRDTASFGLNAKYENVIKQNSFSEATCSFAEFYGACKYTDTDLVDTLVLQGASKERMEKLNKALSKAIITKINVGGGASSHGYTSINTSSLAPDRAKTLKKWLMDNVISDKNFEIQIVSKKEVNVGNSYNNVSGLQAKCGRFAYAIIEYRVPEVSLLEENGNGHFSRNGSYIENDAEKALKQRQGIKENSPVSVSANKLMTTITTSIKNGIHGNKSHTGYRYDYEREYFANLAVNDPVMHKRITDKVKYFDPAFHSITPEGFNARLTFLQQCTRQGHTIASTDKNGWNSAAGNLAFGRPPICVLRLGDFFNTKIAIDSINITYDDNGVQWDMNPEGIGLQPMSCKVSITFTFLGGSDIAAPVARLQNAVSFNYYANTSIYDNRSDTTQYNHAKMESEIMTQWTPEPNLTNR